MVNAGNGVDRDNIHVDVAGGAKASRPKLDLVMQLMREGDTLKVTRLDRLSRSVLHLVTLGAELRKRGIGLHVIEQGIDTATMEGPGHVRDAQRARGAPERADRGEHERRARLRACPRPGRRASAEAHSRPG
ncbi:recombinase family protein [Streptomyces sp. MK37H]|uniref:recombinase family protein n=1 Tax=Streptomyces sp. MK37H TaxID=2699117 RepID=UPI0027E3CA5C|nr:recombinase family protein [Streptomyces sp. MK37H]